MSLTIEELIENFSLLDDWEDKYRYLLDLGKTLPNMDDSDKNKENKVEGCLSQVWMKCFVSENEVFHFKADSDGQIVRGLLAVLQIMFEGKTLSELKKVNVTHVFSELGLEDHLSPNRRNGFYAMVQRIQEFC